MQAAYRWRPLGCQAINPDRPAQCSPTVHAAVIAFPLPNADHPWAACAIERVMSKRRSLHSLLLICAFHQSSAALGQAPTGLHLAAPSASHSSGWGLEHVRQKIGVPSWQLVMVTAVRRWSLDRADAAMYCSRRVPCHLDVAVGFCRCHLQQPGWMWPGICRRPAS